MNILHYVAYFFGALFLMNAIPHVCAGLMGEPFQSPFATPPGKGLSSSKVNALWGSFNVLVGYLLLCRVGDFDLRNNGHVATAFLAFVGGSLLTAHNFGKLHGGNDPR